MSSIKAIETRYKGYRFRSRLEARWAVFFDALGLEWEYEREGYVLADGTRYLPDFWLPQVRLWAEVKPEKMTDNEARLCKMLAVATGRSCLMLEGPPENRAYLSVGKDYNIDYCLTCFHGYPQDEGRFFGNPGCDCAERRVVEAGCQCQFEDTAAAIAAARSARFEHGESGGTP